MDKIRLKVQMTIMFFICVFFTIIVIPDSLYRSFLLFWYGAKKAFREEEKKKLLKEMKEQDERKVRKRNG